MNKLVGVSRELSKKVAKLTFSSPITHVYNPLEYAAKSHEAYLNRHGNGRKQILFIGMNPGPFGMTQTGVPFGEINSVRDWMGICEPVAKPEHEHPKRPIEGFACEKSEVSGRRLWGWAHDRFGSAERFFKDYFVINYCPLVFMTESGKNFTPDQLPAKEQELLFKYCDDALKQCVEILQPKWVIGVGAFAMKRAELSLDTDKYKIAKILHPSPASPAANRGWAQHIEKELKALGIEIPSKKG